MASRVEIYTSSFCPYCVAAKRFFEAKGVQFAEIDISGDSERRRWLAEVTGQRTVPQIFIDGKPYGGYTDVAALDRQGRLDDILASQA